MIRQINIYVVWSSYMLIIILFFRICESKCLDRPEILCSPPHFIGYIYRAERNCIIANTYIITISKTISPAEKVDAKLLVEKDVEFFSIFKENENIILKTKTRLTPRTYRLKIELNVCMNSKCTEHLVWIYDVSLFVSKYI